MSGGHLISHWSSTQASVALSAAEAELNAVTKGGREGISIKHSMESLNMSSEIKVYVDSSSAKGNTRTTGCWTV